MTLPFKPTPPRLVALGAGVLFVVWCIGSGASMFVSEWNLRSAWSDVEAAEAQRVAALEGLEAAASSVGAFAPEPFKLAAMARTAWADADTLTAQVAAIHHLDDAEVKLRAALRGYPKLPSETAYREADLALQEAKKAADTARLAYDQSVQLFNVRLRVFPRNMLANVFGIAPAARFQFAESSPSS